jgi:hypothetical protein
MEPAAPRHIGEVLVDYLDVGEPATGAVDGAKSAFGCKLARVRE